MIECGDTGTRSIEIKRSLPWLVNLLLQGPMRSIYQCRTFLQAVKSFSLVRVSKESVHHFLTYDWMELEKSRACHDNHCSTLDSPQAQNIAFGCMLPCQLGTHAGHVFQVLWPPLQQCPHCLRQTRQPCSSRCPGAGSSRCGWTDREAKQLPDGVLDGEAKVQAVADTHLKGSERGKSLVPVSLVATTRCQWPV